MKNENEDWTIEKMIAEITRQVTQEIEAKYILEKKPVLGCTLLVRDEIDIVETWLNHHIPMCDFLCVTDNGSIDGTREVIQKYAEKYKHKMKVIDETEHDFKQDTWVQRMIDICAEEGCTHIFNSDVDEIWNGDLWKEAAKITGDVGAVRIPSRLFVPTVEDDFDIEDPIERMKYYVKTGRTREEASCMSAWNKLVHKIEGTKNVLGNDRIEFTAGDKKIIDSTESSICHYPERSWTQFRRKYIQGGEAYKYSDKPKEFGWHWRKIYDVYYTRGVIALKEMWYKKLEDDFSKVEKI